MQREARLELLVEKTYFDFHKLGKECKDEPGILNFYCKLQRVVSVSQLADLLGVSIFKEGPHTRSRLILNHTREFGHYNLEFPVKLREYLIPAKKKPSFRAITQPVYDKFIKVTARSYFSVYQKLDSNPDFFDKESKRYETLVEEKRLEPFYLDRFIFFMHPDYTDSQDVEEAAKFTIRKNDENVSGEVTREAVGFWLRRKIDGTNLEFLLGLIDLLKIYDSEFYEIRTNLDAK
ncbi:hypothetical protein P3G55_16160 [Leptospira sp. 96542]|nr:hypothetical protein [Leptospira sp. 96542]